MKNSTGKSWKRQQKIKFFADNIEKSVHYKNYYFELEARLYIWSEFISGICQ